MLTNQCMWLYGEVSIDLGHIHIINKVLEKRKRDEKQRQAQKEGYAEVKDNPMGAIIEQEKKERYRA